MDALQTTHQTQTAIAAGVFLPLVQAALEDRAYDTWLRSCRFRPELYPRNTALEQRLLLGGRVTDAEMREAVETELTIAYRCDLTAVQPAQAAYPLLAVMFTGDVIVPQVAAPQVKRADPVDLLTLGRITGDQYNALSALRLVVGKLLQAEAQHDRAALDGVAAEFQQLQRWGQVWPGRCGLLWSNVLAGNIKLCIRGAR